MLKHTDRSTFQPKHEHYPLDANPGMQIERGQKLVVSNTSVKEARGIILSLSTFLKATDKSLNAITNTNKVGKGSIKLTQLYQTNASQPKTESPTC